MDTFHIGRYTFIFFELYIFHFFQIVNLLSMFIFFLFLYGINLRKVYPTPSQYLPSTWSPPFCMPLVYYVTHTASATISAIHQDINLSFIFLHLSILHPDGLHHFICLMYQRLMHPASITLSPSQSRKKFNIYRVYRLCKLMMRHIFMINHENISFLSIVF